MAIEGKRIAKNTGLLYFRMLLLMAVSLYTSRVLLSTLGVVDYGLYNVVGGVVVMLGFLQGTMSTASARFITVALSQGDMNNMRKIFSNIFIVNVFLAFIVVVLAETIGLWFLFEKMTIPENRMSASIWVYQFSVVSVAMNLVTVPFNASIIAHERMGAFAYISLLDAITKLIIVYLIIISPFDRLIFYAFLILFVHSVDVFIYYLYCIRKFPETKSKLFFDKITIKEIFSFVTWSSYGSFVSVGFTQGLNILLNMFFGPTVNAARGIAVQVQTAVVNFTTNFQTAINPQLMKSTAQVNYLDSQRLLVASSKYSFFLLCMLGIPLVIETPYILSLWLKDVPTYSVSFCRIILILSIWSSLANPLRIINQAEGNIKKFQLYECSLLLLIMPLSYIALEIWRIPILVFIVHFFIEMIAQFVRIVIVVPKIGMKFSSYIRNVFLRLLPVFFLPMAISSCIHLYVNIVNFLTFVVVTLINEIFLIATILLFGLTNEEKRFISSCVVKSMKKSQRNL